MKRIDRCRQSTLATQLGGLLFASVFIPIAASGGETFLEYDFADKDQLEDFFVPPSGDFCGGPIVFGSAAVDEEEQEMVMTNGGAGASSVMLLPEVVADTFPDNRDYRIRVRVNFASHSGIFYIFVRTRMGVDFAGQRIIVQHELGYPVYLDVTNQVFGVIEESNCNVAVPHPEWLPGNGTWAFKDPGFAIEIGEKWYWMEITVSGDDDGGPVRLEAKTWPDGEDPPEEPQYELEDTDGLQHTVFTREASREVQILFLNLFGQAGETVRLDDLTVSDLEKEPEGQKFLRGDCSGDGKLDVTDPISNLSFQFVGTFDPPCRDACDFDDSGELDVTDPIANLQHQFLGGPGPAPPGKQSCGLDLTEDKLPCGSFAPCPG